ncbi:MAG: NADH-quinone oxidoreductase subunit C, partial [Thermoplasmatota archaeon]
MRSKEEHLLDRIREKFDIDGNIQRKRRIWIKIDKDELLELCGCLKKKGFIHLSAISVTDWPDDNVFE